MRNNLPFPPGILWAGAALMLALAGCQTVPVAQAPTVAWSVRREALQTLDRFGLNGRVAVAVGQQGFDAAVRWAQSGATTRLTLSGPLGAGGVRITARGAMLSVITSSGKRLGNDAAREELEDKLGFEPPLGSIRYWVLGVPGPGAPASVTLDAQQRCIRLTQDGWQVDYTSYMSVGAEWLPRLLTLSRAGVRVRMIVEAWQL
jgi:outer membrane lipoprotein LolB